MTHKLLGWGYGGYLTIGILALDEEDKDKRLFRCGIAVSPHTKLQLHGKLIFLYY